MSHLVNERMGKRQPMRWSPEGAHLLLQVRCAVLDNRLEMLFGEQLPKFRRQTPLPLIGRSCPSFDTVPDTRIGKILIDAEPEKRCVGDLTDVFGPTIGSAGRAPRKVYTKFRRDNGVLTLQRTYRFLAT